MKIRLALLLVAGAGVAACSSGPEVRWMKTGPYTSEEFRRDTDACTRSGDLDRACLEARGWVGLRDDKVEVKQPSPTKYIPRPQ